MQSFLNFLFEVIFVTGITYVSVGFILGLVKLWYQSHPHVTAMRAKAEEEKQPTALPVATAPAMDEATKMLDLRECEPVTVEEEFGA